MFIVLVNIIVIINIIIFFYFSFYFICYVNLFFCLVMRFACWCITVVSTSLAGWSFMIAFLKETKKQSTMSESKRKSRSLVVRDSKKHTNQRQRRNADDSKAASCTCGLIVFGS